jgi:hypothetical protein
MMRSFMTSGSLPCGVKLDNGPDERDMTPFHEENAVMTFYGTPPHWGGVACLT